RLDGAQLIWVHDANSSFLGSQSRHLRSISPAATPAHLVRSGWRTGIPRLFHPRLGAVHPLVRAVHPERAVVPAVRGGKDRAEVDAFHADGAVVLRQLLEEHEVELLRAGIDENLAHPSPRAKVASAPGDPGFFLEDFWCWQDNERYREFIFASALGEVGARLMRSTTARLYHDHMLTKEPGTRQRTPWHQDQPYYNISGWQNCSFWIPVDPVSRE